MMNERIAALAKLTLEGKMYAHTTETEFDREDMFLPEAEKDVKRISEYILNQTAFLVPESRFTGRFFFDGSVVGDAFGRSGHKHTENLWREFYIKAIDNLSTYEWQHATADYKKVLEKGLSGIIEEIEDSMKVHPDEKEQEFLRGLRTLANTLIKWAHKCADRVNALKETVENPQYRKNLEKLSEALKNVPEKKPSSFYEAVLSIFVCFSANRDSVGTLDRYLAPFYEADMKAGTLTRDEAKEYLQELFLSIQAMTKIENKAFTRGGESHFCIGGYLPDGSDGFSETSKLIVESLMELPIFCPQITLRWTKKTPREVLRYMMDCERNDPYKRIAFTNDEKRIKCYTEVCGFPYERAVSYTMVGCNEPAFLGSITGSTSKGNVLKCIETLFHDKVDEIAVAQNFDEFYEIFKKEFYSDLQRIFDYDDKFNLIRAKDVSYISSIFFNDCIENARSLTQGGGNTVVSGPMLLGITNLIDSLIVVKQFVFEETLVTVKELSDALKNNWEGHEELRMIILKKGKFFGNDDDLSNGVAQRLYQSFYDFCYGKRNAFGYPWIVGDLQGYNEHSKWFGENMRATPDGRFRGDRIKYGIGQSEGKDRNGLTALLNSLAKLDPGAIACGSTVTNISIDETLIKDDDNFEKTVDLFETYFKNGGVHFQLTYVSREDLLKAREAPENYGNLRVRVTGFSDYFVRLNESIQDTIIERTTHQR